MWTETLSVSGTVATSELDAEFTQALSSDNEDAYDISENVCVLSDSDGDGDYDVATITLVNGYPSFECYTNLTIHNNGGMPLRIAYVTINAPPELDVTIDDPSPVGTILGPCETVWLNLTTHVNDSAAEIATYTFSATVDVKQFNAPIEALTNGRFEMGDFTGWSLTIPSGASAQVVTSHTGDQGTAYDPVEGDYFALLKTDGPGSLTKASQQFEIGGGVKLQGWAAFDARDYLPFNDYAQVRILDSDGNVVATPWYCDVATVGDYGDGPWTQWEWTASTGGTYTLELSITNAYDSEYDSYALFDANVIT